MEGQPVTINAYNATQRYDIEETFTTTTAAQHTLSLINGGADPASQGTVISLRSLEVLPPKPEGSLGVIIGLVLLVVWAVRRMSGNNAQPGSQNLTGQSARDIAQARYAKGEINREEYQ